MNNLRLLTGALYVTLLSGGVCSYGQSAITLEEIFKAAEARSAQLRPSFTAQAEAEQEASIARAGRLPDINATLSVSYIGDGFTTKRDFSDCQRAPIPHLGSGLSLNVTQPVYSGGAIDNAIDLAELKRTASQHATELQRDNIRFRLTGFYLDICRYNSLRQVIEGNLTAARKVLEDMHARHEQGTVIYSRQEKYDTQKQEDTLLYHHHGHHRHGSSMDRRQIHPSRQCRVHRQCTGATPDSPCQQPCAGIYQGDTFQ